MALTAASACRSESKQLAADSVSSETLTGTWRVVRYSRGAYEDSSYRFPFGAKPRGYLVYDSTGHVFFQVLRPSAYDSLLSLSGKLPPDSTVVRLLSGSTAYFGTYVIDKVQRTITHHIEGEFLPVRGLLEIANSYRRSGDTLILGDTLKQWVFVRVRK
jgi:hypothetical protein